MTTTTAPPEVRVVHPGDRMTLAEFEALPDDVEVVGDWARVELLYGVVCVSSAPADWHGLAQGRLWALLEAARPSDVLVVVGPGVVGAESGVIPDLAVKRRDDMGRRQAAPLLVVEVLSPGTRTRDRRTKRDLYAHLGVEHYWLVDTDEPSVLVLRLAPTRRAGRRTPRSGRSSGTSSSRWPPPSP